MGDLINADQIDNFTVGITDSQLFKPHAISHRRKIGAFYTPIEVTTILCKWGIRSKNDLILEPCFGGCTFLEASLMRLQSLGQTQAHEHLYGCDIDPLAFQYLAHRDDGGSRTHHEGNFVLKDFLSLDVADDHDQKFDLVIGNPPYVRHNEFDQKQRETIKNWSAKYAIKVGGRASLWAYFILHALHFLKEGGRVAWVLPGSFLTSAYSKPIRDLIVKKFSQSIAITLVERLFISEGTEEVTVVLFADGYQLDSSTSMQTICLDTVDELSAFVSNWHGKRGSLNSSIFDTGMVPRVAVNEYERLCMSAKVRPLKDFANVQIGLVTGDLKYFVKSKSQWKALQISKKSLRYIVPKSKWLSGISLNNEDVKIQQETDIECLALNCSAPPVAGPVREYLDSYKLSKIRANSTFARRSIWHYFFDERIPDAFLVFMTHLGPRLILNYHAANCTNSIYRVNFNNTCTEITHMLVALSLHTTFTQLSAEIVGQGRGSGALKLEPSNALELKIYLPEGKTDEEIRSVFSFVDQMIRDGDHESATILCDEFFFAEEKQFKGSMKTLSSGLSVARIRRMRV